ncbi:hypothetical protein SO694_00060168 [Aureococcus anophagefferens]|uniref:Uncharacterized protein n=1 Tax=Aureococcus anophagefferens TaxID=44056 RepID=A0ABR1FR31_AURAN
MIARPKISRNERKTTEIGAFEVGNFAPAQARCYAMDRSFAASAVASGGAALALRRSLDVEACGRLRNHAILDALVVLHSRHEGILPGSHRRCVLDRPATTSSLSRLSGGKFENPTVDSIYDSAHHAYRTYRSMRMDGRAAFDLCLKERLAFVGDHGNPRQSFDVAESAEKARLPSVLHLPEPASHELPAPPGHRPSTIKRMGAAIDRILNMLVGALIVLGSACVAADDAYAAPDAPSIEFSPVVPSRVSPSNPFTLEALVRTGGAAATIEWSADVDDAALLTRARARPAVDAAVADAVAAGAWGRAVAVVNAAHEEAVARGAASDDDVRALREGLVAHLLFIAEHEQPLKIFEVTRCASEEFAFASAIDDLGVALAKDLVPGEEPAAVASPGAALRVARVETADAVDVDFAASDEPGASSARLPGGLGRRRALVDVAVAELGANSRPTLPARVDTRVVRSWDYELGSTARRPTRPPPAGRDGGGDAGPGLRARRRRGRGDRALLVGDDGACLRCADGAADWDAEACTATASTADATACECPAIDGGADYAATTNQEAQLAYVRRSFADPLDKKLATSSIPLVKLFAGFAGFWLLVLVWGVWADRRAAAPRRARGRREAERERNGARTPSGRRSAGFGGAAEDAYKEKSRQAHVLGLRASLPVAVAKGPVGRERAGACLC